MTTLIVGGGIAGLTTALALKRRGIESTVLESRSSMTGTGGAFLVLAPNGINALRSLGLRAVPVDAGGFEVEGIDMYNARGRRVGEVPGEQDGRRYGAFSMVLRRERLQEELGRSALAAGIDIRFGCVVSSIREHADGVIVSLSDGTNWDADAVIGADGIRSAVRRSTWASAPLPTYTGIVDCGGWTPVDLPDTPRQQMYFGHRAFFGYTVRAGVAYWFTNVPVADEPARDTPERAGRVRGERTWEVNAGGARDALHPVGSMARLRDLHADDPQPIRAILAATSSPVGAWPLYDLPTVPAWSTDRTCLLGDAAHATSPSTGQGASLSIEDAVVLAECMASAPGCSAAFSRFVALRKPRAEKVMARGRRIGARKVASAAGSVFRDLTLPLFLKLAARATVEQYGYRAEQEVHTAS